MLIGARTATWGGDGEWKNPYITDGLVAMWDGEWNVGRGFHDSMSKIWRDLSDNGYDLECSINNPNIHENYISFDRDCAFYRYAKNDLIGAIHCEVVFSYFGYADKDCVFILHDGNKVSQKFICINNLTSSGARFCAVNTSVNNIYGMSYSFGENFMYVNGEMKRYSYTIGWYPDAVVHDLIGGVRVGNAYYNKFKGNVYCVRLYSRALTDEERLANYDVDRSRFNLT